MRIKVASVPHTMLGQNVSDRALAWKVGIKIPIHEVPFKFIYGATLCLLLVLSLSLLYFMLNINCWIYNKISGFTICYV